MPQHTLSCLRPVWVEVSFRSTAPREGGGEPPLSAQGGAAVSLKANCARLRLSHECHF